MAFWPIHTAIVVPRLFGAAPVEFLVGFCDPKALEAAQDRPVRGYWPHLRLVPLSPLSTLGNACIPEHLLEIVLAPDGRSKRLDAIVSASPQLQPPSAPYDSVRVVSWDEINSLYDAWMHEVYLPFHRSLATYVPDGLNPISHDAEQELSLEIVGSCTADGIGFVAKKAAEHFGVKLNPRIVTYNHPTPLDDKGDPADIQLVLPSFRFMSPNWLDRYFDWEEPEKELARVFETIETYLGWILQGLSAPKQRFIVGFIEPSFNHLGYDIDPHGDSNLKNFIKRANEFLANWCAAQQATWFIDGNAIAARLGLYRVDDELAAFSAHRTAAYPPDDDNLDGQDRVTPYRAQDSFENGYEAYYANVLWQALARRITNLGVDPVKIVITDLDNTLWRGVAAEDNLGSSVGRPAAYGEALKILKRRGILLAIASKNDASYIKDHWDQLCRGNGLDPINAFPSFDDFAITRINFQSKSQNVKEILEATNISPQNAVFIDDNPLERQEVQTAFPKIRVLGSELNYLRRELLLSPYTQRNSLTAEDQNRTTAIKSRIAFHDAPDTKQHLASLGLKLKVGIGWDWDSTEAKRCIQLINKTNQWNLNGNRLELSKLPQLSELIQVLVWGQACDTTGDHGIVVAAVVSLDKSVVSHMVVSCRVIGMGIDEAFAAELANAFGPLDLNFATTERNRAAEAFIHRFGTKLIAPKAPEHIEVINLCVAKN